MHAVTSVVSFMLLVCFGAFASPVAAHQSPRGCTANSLSVSISRPDPTVLSGDLIPYTVALQVPDTFGNECDASDIIVAFFPPNDPPNGTTPCSSTNGVVLRSSEGNVIFSLSPGDVVVFTPADNPILNYFAQSEDLLGGGRWTAWACGYGISHTAPGDPDSAIDNREISTFCAVDLDGNGTVDVDDLVEVILAWGTAGADTNDDGTTDVDDLVQVILSWGGC